MFLCTLCEKHIFFIYWMIFLTPEATAACTGELLTRKMFL